MNNARDELKHGIEGLIERPLLDHANDKTMEVFFYLLNELDAGTIRAAERNDQGQWHINRWVKQGILLGFKLGDQMDYSQGHFRFFDKHTFPPKTVNASAGVRIVPGGSSIRSGAYLGTGVVCMPPMYVNVGAYVGEDTMIDSHALVGSCAQIGKRVHLSAAAQIGGVLEPVNALPVIVEDDVFIGGGCGIYEGCLVREGAVLAPGVILTRATRLYDLVHERVITAGRNETLEVPAGAVVVPGSRPGSTPFAQEHNLSIYTPIIIKYRDKKTDAATLLEDGLRAG